jgi:hypothetical protein
MRRAFPALLLALCLAACGAEGGSTAASGSSATLWVTQDRGADVVLTSTVPTGLNAIQALDRKADIETRYGGRYIQSVNGVEGSLNAGRDWFYFVNGIEPDVGGVEVKLHTGDVVWWDFREWSGGQDEPVVVGAFPEPFLHGWGGKRRPAQVQAPPGLAGEAAELRGVLGGAGGEGEPNLFVLDPHPGVAGAKLTAKRGDANDAPVIFTLAGSTAAVRAAAEALADDPSIVRYRYEAEFDETGRVVG